MSSPHTFRALELHCARRLHSLLEAPLAKVLVMTDGEWRELLSREQRRDRRRGPGRKHVEQRLRRSAFLLDGSSLDRRV